MTWIFKNRKGEEILISDTKLEEYRNSMKIPDIGSFTIPELTDNSYHLDKYEES